MRTNILLLVAALAIIVLVLVHFFQSGRHDDRRATRVFLIYAVIGAFDISLDAVTSLLSDSCAFHSIALLQATYTAFYLLQCLVPLLVLVYVVLLCSDMGTQGLGRWQKSLLACGIVVTLCMIVVVFANLFTGWLFSFDEITHIYVHGTYYSSMYIYAVCYCVFALAYATAHRRALRHQDLMAVWELGILMGVCSILQLATESSVLVTGFGIGLGILVLFMTSNNPLELVDPLTGALDLTRFRSRASQLITHDQRFSVVLVSLDYLKRLNPILGPTTIDGTILMCSQELATSCRAYPVFRLRRSLFASIVTSDIDRQRIVGHMRGFFADQHNVNGLNLTLEASVGFVPSDVGIETADELQSYIDYLIEQAHRTGSWPASLSSHHGALAAFRRSEVVHRCIEDALRKDLFEVRLQPIFSLKERGFVSAEVLSRLNHPDAGQISPAEFIPIAENEGYVTQIGRLQFEKICSIVARNQEALRAKGIRSVKVNLSAVELLNSDLGEFLLDAMKRHDLDPSNFQFEITETTATRYTSELNRLLEVLLKAGSAICMDDFGSGYANFNALTRLPFSVMKIDISLLEPALQDKRAALLYRGILDTGKSLGLSSVCEGVETAEQVRKLEEWGADQLQGFFFAHPLTPEELLGLDPAQAIAKLDAVHADSAV